MPSIARLLESQHDFETTAHFYKCECPVLLYSDYVKQADS
jgi:hypothetical protein